MPETSALPSSEPLPNIPNKSVPSETLPLETTPAPGTSRAGAATEDLWKRLRLPHYQRNHPPVANANTVYHTDLVIHLMRHLECRVSDEELRAIAAEHDLAQKLEASEPADKSLEAGSAVA